MGYILELVIIIGHCTKYKQELSKIAMNFGITFALSKVMSSVEDKNKSDMIKLAGYSLTFESFIDYLSAVKTTLSGQDSSSDEGLKIWNVVPKLIDMIKEYKN